VTAPIVPSVEAVEYGRRVLNQEIGRLNTFVTEARNRGNEEAAQRWLRIRRWFEYQMLGSDKGGCVVAPFDRRWLDPKFREAMEQVRAYMLDGAE
jgi:hypothetical protein